MTQLLRWDTLPGETQAAWIGWTGQRIRTLLHAHSYWCCVDLLFFSILLFVAALRKGIYLALLPEAGQLQGLDIKHHGFYPHCGDRGGG